MSPSKPYRAPLLGEHNDEVVAASDPAPDPRNGRTAGNRRTPLDGLRVVDLTMFMSGPLTTLLAADLGADVIKVEAIQRLDGWRGVGRAGPRPWENSGAFNWINRSKRGVTLNLNDPRGVELLKRLVAVSDVVIENYTPRVMSNFGLGYNVLREINPDLVMISMPGFGVQGPWRDYSAFAWTTEQMSGICDITGYPDGGPLFTGTTCGDPLAGLMGAVALLAALNHRRRTGIGQHVDLSQVEAATSFVGDVVMQAEISGEAVPRRGNRHAAMAPHGVYPCRDGRWIAIACRSDAEWRALADLLEDTGAGVEAPMVDLRDRLAAVQFLDEHLSAWTTARDAADLMHALQCRGVPAGTVLSAGDLYRDAHLRERGFFVHQDRSGVGGSDYFNQPFRFASAALRAPTAAPFLGGSNNEVLGDLLGVSEAELAELQRDAVIGDSPLGA